MVVARTRQRTISVRRWLNWPSQTSSIPTAGFRMRQDGPSQRTKVERWYWRIPSPRTDRGTCEARHRSRLWSCGGCCRLAILPPYGRGLGLQVTEVAHEKIGEPVSGANGDRRKSCANPQAAGRRHRALFRYHSPTGKSLDTPSPMNQPPNQSRLANPVPRSRSMSTDNSTIYSAPHPRRRAGSVR